jgi:hypothetical protein
MAGLQEVTNILVGMAGVAVYPHGSTSASVSGDNVRIFPGWPQPDLLQRDMGRGVAQVSVYPLDTENRTTERPEWQEIRRTDPTISVSVVGDTASLSGLPSYPMNVALLIDQVAFVHPLQTADTLSTVATSLATQISVEREATSSGVSITVPGALEFEGRVGQIGTAVRELKRQKRVFQTTVWAPSARSRDLLSEAIDVAFARTPRIDLPDGLPGHLVYERSPITDDLAKIEIFRRDLRYSVEWATTESREAPEIVVNETRIKQTQGELLASFDS